MFGFWNKISRILQGMCLKTLMDKQWPYEPRALLIMIELMLKSLKGNFILWVQVGILNNNPCKWGQGQMNNVERACTPYNHYIHQI